MATDGYIQLPTDGSGKKIDADQLTTSQGTVYRERGRVAGTGAGELQDVRGGGAESSGSDYGSVVRQAPAVSPQSYVATAALALNGSQTFAASAIPAGLTGYLSQVRMSSTGLVQWTIQDASNNAYGVTNASSDVFEPPDKTYVTIPAASHFQVIAQNLSPEPVNVFVTIFWDQHA